MALPGMFTRLMYRTPILSIPVGEARLAVNLKGSVDFVAPLLVSWIRKKLVDDQHVPAQLKKPRVIEPGETCPSLYRALASLSCVRPKLHLETKPCQFRLLRIVRADPLIEETGNRRIPPTTGKVNLAERLHHRRSFVAAFGDRRKGRGVLIHRSALPCIWSTRSGVTWPSYNRPANPGQADSPRIILFSLPDGVIHDRGGRPSFIVLHCGCGRRHPCASRGTTDADGPAWVHGPPFGTSVARIPLAI